MKLLCFVDLHKDSETAKELISKFRMHNPDIVCCCGDISCDPIEVKKVLMRFGQRVPILFIPGNHEEGTDYSKAIKPLKNVIDLHKKVKEIDGVLFLGSGGGGFSGTDPVFEKVKVKFKEEVKRFKAKGGKKVVLMTHAPPYKTKCDLVYGEYAGAKNIKDFDLASKVDLHLCGHLHECAHRRETLKSGTLVVNPGKDGEILEM